MDQLKERVLKHFTNIEQEAEQYAEAEYNRIGRLTGSENFDMEHAADAAFDIGAEFYTLLDNMKTQMMLSALPYIINGIRIYGTL